MAQDLEELQASEVPGAGLDASRASRICGIPDRFSARSDAISPLLSMIGVFTTQRPWMAHS